jgi:hypothetical protein
MKTGEVIEAAKRFSKPHRVTNGEKFRLTDVDPGDTGLLARIFSRLTICGGPRQPTCNALGKLFMPDIL